MGQEVYAEDNVDVFFLGQTTGMYMRIQTVMAFG